MSYPHTVDLPFNAEIIRERFAPKKPGEVENPGPGYWVILQGDTLVLDGGALYRGAFPAGIAPVAEPIFFGLWDGEPLRVATLSSATSVPAPLAAVSINDLSDELMTLMGLGRQIVYWQRMSVNCSRCGSLTEGVSLTWGKKCLSCGHEHYPHIHPCVIVLVRRGDEFLLARKAEWPQGRYSLVAGFVDFGESLEECVVREVREETGIEVHNVRYVGSQNWPFPSQLMAGFLADHREGEIVVDGNELEDARWFSGSIQPDILPPKRSIARWIIDRFAYPAHP